MLAVAKIDAAARFFLLAYAAVLGFSRAGIHASVIALVLVFLCRFLRKPFQLELDKNLLLAMKAFGGTLLLSTLLSSDQLASIRYLGVIAFRFLPFFIVLAFVNEARFPERLITFMAGSLVVGSVTAIVQGLQGAERARSFLGQMDFGGILGLLIPLLVIQGLENREYKPCQTKLLLTAALLGCIALLFNGTRAVWVSVGLCLLGTFFVLKKSKKVIAISVILVITSAAIIISSPQVMFRANTLFDKAYKPNTERVTLWKHGWEQFLAHPIIGTGLATLPTPQTFILTEEAKSGKPIYGHVHNNFIQMLAENGVIGLGAFLFLFGTIIYSGWRKRTGPERAWGLSAAVCTIGFLIHGSFDYNFNIATIIYTYWLIIGMIYAKYKLSEL